MVIYPSEKIWESRDRTPTDRPTARPSWPAADEAPRRTREKNCGTQGKCGKECGQPGGVCTVIAMHCGCRIFKMAAKVQKFPRLYALYFDRYSSFLRKLSTIT